MERLCQMSCVENADLSHCPRSYCKQMDNLVMLYTSMTINDDLRYFISPQSCSLLLYFITACGWNYTPRPHDVMKWKSGKFGTKNSRKNHMKNITSMKNVFDNNECKTILNFLREVQLLEKI